ncbi:MAG TPA: trypsin-like serine protease [Polyangiaceae bacterium]|nr:trypsin-like serine protease [Polyangiaceae bacterium]
MTRAALLFLSAALGLTGCIHAALPWATSPPPAPVRPASAQAGADVGDLDALLAPNVAFAGPGDAIVRVVGPQVTCSGVLLAENLVLTAHHCVVRRDHGEFTERLVATGSLEVQLGADYLPWGNVGVKAILAPPCGEAGGRGDVAVLVLERRLVGIATMSLQVDPPRAGEEISSAGFGRCALSPEGIRRRERLAGPIGIVYSGTFEAQASVCPGDSGGPALDRITGEVVGVVSLSAMDHDETTSGRSVFARVDGAPKLVAYARLVADGADPADLPPLACDR